MDDLYICIYILSGQKCIMKKFYYYNTVYILYTNYFSSTLNTKYVDHQLFMRKHM